MSTEFEVNGKKYRAGKLDAMTQWHVFRRLGPILPAVQSIQSVLPDLLAGGEQAEAAMAALTPMTEAIASMSDADSEYILGACLGVVQREQSGGGWASVWSTQAKRPMFDDIGMLQMLQISFQVLSVLRPF